MSSPAIILFLFISLLFTTATTKKPTILELLEKHVVPAILTTTDIKSSTLNRDTGEFKVKLGDVVQFLIMGHTFACKRTIRGVMSKDMTSASELEGISVKMKGSDYWVDVMELTWIIGDFDIDNAQRPDYLDVAFSVKPYPDRDYAMLLQPDTGDRGLLSYKVVVRFVKVNTVKVLLKLLKWLLALN